MSIAGRRKDGPLSPLQKEILDLLIAGKRQNEIAEQMGFSTSYISAETLLAVTRMGMRTTTAAVARYRSYQTYRMTATLLMEKGIIPVPIDEAEVHVNHVLEGMAALIKRRAERLLPS